MRVLDLISLIPLHTLYIDADRVTTADRELIPHGEFRDVEGTPFDFRKPKKVGKDIGCTDDCDIANGGGYDINYVLNRRGEYRKVAEIAGAESGVAMEVCTDLPGLQFYSGNMLDTEKYKKRTGFCLETQFLPKDVYKRQVLNGVAVRMALLFLLARQNKEATK